MRCLNQFSYFDSLVLLSRYQLRNMDTCHGNFGPLKIFGPGPKFSENFGPVGPILSEKKGPCQEKKVRRFISNVHVVDTQFASDGGV